MNLDGYIYSSNEQPTIIDKLTMKPFVAQRNEISEEDIREINSLYNCSIDANYTSQLDM